LDVDVLYMAVQSGISYQPDGNRLVRDPLATPENEQQAIAKLGEALSIPGRLTLLLRDSFAARALNAKLWPVNILIDSQGTVREVLTGPEREKVVSLFELSKSCGY
jgi:hypothetical protein